MNTANILAQKSKVGLGRLRPHHVIWAISGLTPPHIDDHSQSLPLTLRAPTLVRTALFSGLVMPPLVRDDDLSPCRVCGPAVGFTARNMWARPCRSRTMRCAGPSVLLEGEVGMDPSLYSFGA
eukprot:1192283-Prorocentrum_minimum.AAC.1